MATWQIQIPRDQHTSLQIGDIIYYTNTSGSSNYSVVDLSANATPLDGSNTSAISFFTVGGSTSVFNVNNEGSSGQSLQRLGILQVINNTTSLDDGTETTTLSISVQSTFNITAPTHLPPNKSFIFFIKDNRVNSVSLLGYFAKIQFKNDSKKKAELFTVSAEISESSK